MTNSLNCKVENHLGEPALFINNEPVVPFMFYGYAAQIGKDFNFINQAKMAKEAGVNIYSIPVEFTWITEGENPVYSTMDNVLKGNPYEPVDKVLGDIVKLDPEALILPRFYLHPPMWWLEENPEEKMAFSDGLNDRICIASKKWQNYVKRSLKAFVRHCEQKFGNHIIGYHPALLTTDEFFYDRSWDPVFSGFEEPLKVDFKDWVINKYSTVDKLREAWQDDQITFDNISLPTADQRAETKDGFFRDSEKEKFVIDFYKYKNNLVAETIKCFAKIVKEETNRNKIYIAFYGYTFELSAIPKGIQITGHLNLKDILKNPDVDVICSPISYLNRREGGIGAFMAPVDSIRKAGKLWINEDDTRTYLCSCSGQEPYGDLESLDHTLGVHLRNFSRILPRRMGTWYMDLFNKGWLDCKQIWNQIAEFKKIYQKKLSIKSSFNPEVAVIIDERSPCYLSCTNDLTWPLYSCFRTQLYRMGSSFNLYLLSDVLDGSVELPKVNIFLGAWYLEKNERIKLTAALKDKVAVWFYGAGYFDENGSSKDNISSLTGFDFSEAYKKDPEIKFLENDEWNDKLAGSFFKPLIDGGSDDSGIFQTADQEIKGGYEKIWAVKNEGGVTPLAVYNDETVGLAVKKYSGFTSIYSGIAGLPVQFLRNVLKASGVHVYLESDEIMESDDKFLAVSAYDNKEKSINLDSDKYLFNVFEKTKLFPVNNVVKDEFQAGETKLYRILDKETSD